MGKQQDLFRTQIRIPADVYEAIKESAEEEGRSINAEMVHLMSTALRAKGSPLNTADEPINDSQLKIHYQGFVLVLDDYAATTLTKPQRQRIEALPRQWKERVYQRVQQGLFDVILHQLNNWKHNGIQNVILERLISEIGITLSTENQQDEKEKGEGQKE